MKPAEERTAIHDSVQAHMERQEWAEAADVLSTVAERAAGSFELSWNRGWALYKLDDFEGAIAHLGRAAELDPSSPVALWALGVVYGQLDEADVAEDFLTRSLEAGDSLPARFELAFLYHRQGRLDEALEQHERNLELHPLSPEAHLALADFLSDLGREEDAAQHYERARRLAD
jgi:tetratricopeptide (TPR) repeat protein